MSIINQTLRALDARQPGRAAARAADRPPAIAKSHPAKLWIAVLAAVLLPIAGLTVWFMSRPTMKSLPQPPARVSHTPPASSPAVRAPSPAKEVAIAVPVISDNQRRGEDASAEAPLRVPASPPRLSAAPVALDSPRPAVAQPPAIRKEISQPTDSEKAEEHYRMALTRIRANQQDQARTQLETALDLSPRHVAARETLAALLSGAGNNQEAEKVLRIGRETNPEHPWFAFSLGRLQAARGDTAGAVATLQGGMEGRSVSADYHATLAALQVRLKQYPDAVRQYQQALKLQSGQGTWWLGLGLSLEAQGRNDEARVAFQRALTVGNLPDKLAEFVRAKLAE